MAEAAARLLVALDAAEETLAMLESFASLAAGLQRELVGLLVEDPALAQAAALPFTQLVSRRVPGVSAFEPATVRRAVRVFARHLERRLADTCTRYQVSWSFRVTHGGLAEVGLAEGDVLVFGPRGPSLGDAPWQAICPIVLMRAAGHTVVVLYDGGEATLRVGRALAERERLPLRVLVLKGEPPAETGGEIEVLGEVDEEALRQRIAEARPRAVVLEACSATLRWPAAVAALSAPSRHRSPHR